MNEPLLTVVVGTHNRLDQLRRLVQSVERETSLEYELVVTDAGSTDGTIDYLKSIASPRIKPVFVGEKLGQARAYNTVFEQTTSQYVCWLSDDNEIVNNGLDVAVRALKSDDRVGMVGLKVRDVRGPYVDVSYIGAISSAGILNVNQGVLRTSVLKGLGGFDEEFRDYGIDPDLTARVLFAGHDIVFTREIVIHHYRNWSEDALSEESKELQRKRERGRRLYEATYGGSDENDAASRTRKNLWRIAGLTLGTVSGLSVNSPRRIFGNLPRDYYNALHARYISPLDPLLSIHREWHLRQRCRKRPS